MTWRGCRSVFCLVLLAAAAAGEWSSDPNVNTVVFGSPVNEDLSKVLTDGQGNFWIACMSHDSAGATNHRILMQKLNFIGDAVFTSPIVAGEHEPMSWYSDMGLALLPGGSVVVSYPASGEYGNSSAYANVVAPDGSLPWGTDGVTLQDDSVTIAYSPIPFTLADGSIVVAWTCTDDTEYLRMQKLSAAGTPQWGSGIDLNGISGESYDWAGFVPADNGFYLVWVGRITSGSVFEVNGYAQRFDMNGEAQWPQPFAFCSTRNMYEQDPPVAVSDGEGGLYVTWAEYTGTLSQVLVTKAQHILPDGSITMDTGGTLISSDPVNLHFGCSPVYVTETGHLGLFWLEQYQNGTTLEGLRGQLMSQSGEPFWPDTGIVYQPLSATDAYFGILARRSDTADMLCVYGHETMSAPYPVIEAFLVSQNGAPVWTGWPVTISGNQTDKGFLEVTDLYWGQQWILVWTEDRGSGEDVYAQNLKLDGTLGPAGLGFGRGQLYGSSLTAIGAWPNPAVNWSEIVFLCDTGGPVEVSLYDILGRRVMTECCSAYPGSNSILLPLDELSAGLYLYRLTREAEAVSGSFLVVR